jgi:hypothetical protein
MLNLWHGHSRPSINVALSGIMNYYSEESLVNILVISSYLHENKSKIGFFFLFKFLHRERRRIRTIDVDQNCLSYLLVFYLN